MKIGTGQAQQINVVLTAGIAVIKVTADEPTAEEQQEQVSPLLNINNDLTPLLQVVPGAVATGPSAFGRVIVDGKGNDQQTVRLDGVDFTVLIEIRNGESWFSRLEVKCFCPPQHYCRKQKTRSNEFSFNRNMGSSSLT